ncbi:MAG: hypothetical protein J5449_06215, partial [Oscillospiraceae bacterium]|nr:hypothetical protein [Oscillospiraceae bacterium]
MKRRNKALSILLTLAMLLWLIPVRSARASLSKDGAVLAESGLLCVGGVNIAEAANNTVEDELGGKAVLRYDDEGNPVLTLTGYTYEGQGYFAEEDPRTVAGAIYYSGTAPLTVYLSGTSNVTQVTRKVSAPQTACGVYSASAPLIFAGNGTLTAKGGNTADIVTFNGDELQEEFGMSLGVNAKAVTVEKGAAIYAAGSMASKYSCGVKCGSLTLSDASTRLTALGCETEDGSCSCGVNCDSLTVGDGATLIASGEGRAIFGTVKNAVTGSGYSKADSLGGWETIDFNNTDEGQQLTYKCVKFPVHYDLWLGGTQVNAYNRTGVPAAVGTSSGTASYDAETNTLTLNQYTYSGEACVTFSETDEYNAALIWFGTDELTIALTGTNSVTEQESNDETVVSFGVYSGSAGLRFTGDGSLEIADGLLCKNGNVIVENGAALSVTGNEIGSTSHGVRCETGSVTVSGKGSSLTAVGGSSRYISCGVRCDTGSVTVEDGASLTATGKAAASISCGVWCVNKGGVTVGNSATLIAD